MIETSLPELIFIGFVSLIKDMMVLVVPARIDQRGLMSSLVYRWFSVLILDTIVFLLLLRTSH